METEKEPEEEGSLLLFDGGEKAWSLQDSSASPHTRLCSSPVGTERRLAQTLPQTAVTTNVGHGNWQACSLKQMGLTVLSRKRRREMRLRACLGASTMLEEPVLPTFVAAGCPTASSLATSPTLGVCEQPFPSLHPQITTFYYHFLSLKYKFGCRSFGPILPVATIRYFTQ